MKKTCTSLIAGILTLLTGCTSAGIEEFKGREPRMDVREYFNGHVEAYGVFINRSGMVEEQFRVDMNGAFDDKGGTLDEVFTYIDGTIGKRLWKIEFQDDHHFTGTAHDVIGTSKGTQFGNAVNMAYVLRVPVKDSTYDINMDDWMYRMDEKTLINKITMTKFGFKVGELVITFRKT